MVPSMPDVRSQARVKRLRESRRASGEVETNVWLPAAVREAIDAAVKAGRFPNRRTAIVHALQSTFAEMKQM